MVPQRNITDSGMSSKDKFFSSCCTVFMLFLSFQEEVVTKVSLSCLKCLSLQQRQLTGT